MDDELYESPEMTAELDVAGRFLAIADRTNRFFATAYLLELMGILDSSIKLKLDSITQELGHPWQMDVEEQNNISAAFARELYLALCDRLLPHEAVAFILRGLGYFYPEPIIEELISGETDSLGERA